MTSTALHDSRRLTVRSSKRGGARNTATDLTTKFVPRDSAGALSIRARFALCFVLAAFTLLPLTNAQTALGTEALPQNPTPQTLASEQRTAAINGLVTDIDGVPIIGAALTLTPAEGSAVPRETASDADGRFFMGSLAAGVWTLEANFQGFDTAGSTMALQSGQTLSLPPIALHISTVQIEVNAVIPTREIAAEELHLETQQRLLGIAPNFFVSYKWNAAPLTAGQKYTLAWKNVRDPGNLALVGMVAGFQQATDEFNGYGQGLKGYGRRYGADLGNLVVGTFMGGAVLPSLFHQDPRYFYKGTGSVRSRLWYALSSAVICRGDNGKRQFAWSGVLGDLSAGAISNTYYAPEDRHGAALTLENGFLGVAGDALNGLVQEFFFKQITPKPKDAKKTP